MIQKLTTAIIGFAFICSTVTAQTTSADNKKNIAGPKWSVRADYFKPTPLTTFANASKNGFHYPMDFGFTVGAERTLRVRKNTRMYQYATIGFYNHVYFERVTTLGTGLGFYRKIFKTIGTNFEFDCAYNRASSSHLISVIESGNWVSKVDNSKKFNRFAFTLGGNFEYDFAKRTKAHFPLAITLGYNISILAPFDKNINPFFAYHQPRLGIKWKL